jgi:hypothetical protein
MRTVKLCILSLIDLLKFRQVGRYKLAKEETASLTIDGIHHILPALQVSLYSIVAKDLLSMR